MFIPGDLVECLQDYKGQFTKGKLYTILKQSYYHVEVIDDRGVRNGWAGSNFKLANGSQQSQASALPRPWGADAGSVVRCAKDLGPFVVGDSYQVSFRNYQTDQVGIAYDKGVFVLSAPAFYDHFRPASAYVAEGPQPSQYCTPKAYEGFTERYYYCTQCDTKEPAEVNFAYRICDKSS